MRRVPSSISAPARARSHARLRHTLRVVAVDVSEPMVAAIHAHGIEAVHAGFLTYRHEGAPLRRLHLPETVDLHSR
jgi:hypothetical protein